MWNVCHRFLILVLRAWADQGTARTWSREPGEPQNEEQHPGAGERHENPKNQERKNCNNQGSYSHSLKQR